MTDSQSRTKTRRIGRIKFAISVLLLVVLAGFFLFHSLQNKYREDNAFDRVLALVERSVFLGPILENEPEAKARLREAILSNIDMADDDNAKHAVAVAISLNRQYASPALRGADDVNILNIWLTRAETILWLSDRNAEACAVFVRNGSVWPADLNKDFLEIYQRHLEAQKTAYLDGHGKKPRATLDEATFSTLMLGYLGLDETGIAVLEEPSSRTAEEICNVGVTTATGLGNIPEQHQLPFVRHFLTVRNPF